jgi:succinate dehydrogenase / fumarate reductase iron-sulfur subunit
VEIRGKKLSAMSMMKITLQILRYKPDRIDPPRYQEYSLEANPDMSVLDALEAIRLKQDNSLMYRHSCHHSSCGTCACKINGRERLTCITKIKELKGNLITLEPLDGFKVSGDLVVDISPFYDDISEDWSYLKKSDNGKATQLPDGIKEFERFENCIECGACISACPVTHKNSGFIGPAVLAALSNELKKSPQNSKSLFELAGNKHGERLCERALNCSRVCPTGVYPARHIADLRQLLENKSQQ